MTICSETTQLKDTVLHLLAATSGTDQTNYGNDATLTAGATVNSDGFFEFDGVDDTLTITSLNIGTVHTLSMWLRTTDAAWYSHGNHTVRYALRQSSGLLYYRPNTGTVSVTHDVSDGLWHNVVVVRDGLSVSWYVDGVQTGSTQTLAADNDMIIETIGGISGGGFLDGEMEDIRVISRAITVTEIRELYNATARPDITGTVLHLKPETGLVDQSGTQDPATYNGDAAISGRRFSFDGTGDSIALDSTILLSSDYTLSCWVYRNATLDDGMFGGAGTTNLVRLNSGTAGVGYRGVSDNYSTFSFPSSSVPSGQWLFFTLTKSGTNVRAYINTIESTTGAVTDSGALSIAKLGDAHTASDLDGYLDDIRIVDGTAITAAQMATLYEGVPGWEPSPAPRQIPGTVLHLEAATGERDQSYYQQACTFSGSNIADDSSDDAFVFNGTDDYVNITPAPLQSVAAFSVSFWLNPTNAGSKNWFGKWSGFLNPGTDKQVLFRNDIEMFVRNSADSADASASGPVTITDGVWWHIVGIADGTNLTVYVNGAAGTPVALAGPYLPTTSDGWAIGQGHGSYATGSIRDIRILNTALTADSVALLYNKGVANYRPPGLLGGEQLALMMSRHEVGVLPGTVLQLDGSTEYADQSGLGNDATNSGTTITDGKFVFDGVSDYISQDMPSHNGFASGTIAVWFKADASQVTNARLVSIGEDAANQVEFFIDAAKKLNAFAYISWAVQFNFVSDSTVNDDAWHHGVMTWESNSALMYVDGTLQAASDTSTAVSLTSAAGKLSIGEKFDISGKVFNGELDDIRIFNRALSAAEITTLYNNTIQDESANGNHGVMTNGAYVGEDDEIVLDGVDDYVDCGASTPAIGTGDLTISAWYYRETSDTNNRRLLATGGATGTQAGYAIMANQSQVRLRVSDGTNSVLDGPTLTLATWQHIAAVVDNTTNEAYVYLDGALETTIDISSLGSVANTTNLLIGYGHTPGTEWPGSIRDARIFNRALSAAEILALASEYEFQVPNTRGSVLGIVPSYFDTEADVTAIDWSGFGNAGVLTNGPTYTADVDEGGTRAIEFDGVNDRVEVAPHSIADALPWSVAMWIYRATGYESVEGLYGNGGAASRAFFYNNTVLYVFNEADTQSTTFAVSPAIDGWTHITLVCDGTAASNLSYYEDGVFGSTKTLAASDHVWTHFAAYSTSSDTIIGKMDDTYIFDRALNLDEIKALASTRNYFNCPVAEANLFGDAIKIWMGLTH